VFATTREIRQLTGQSLRGLPRGSSQKLAQVGMDAAVNSNWSQLDVETTTSPFSVEEAERRVKTLD
jgi:hypothetical protein